MNTTLCLIAFFSVAASLSACDFDQHPVMDTVHNMLQISPDYTQDSALRAHAALEKRLASKTYDLVNDFYLFFRYRDDSMIFHWLKLLVDNPDNQLMQLWFINALSHLEIKKHLHYVVPFKTSPNSMLREYCANAYGFLGTSDSIPVLNAWLESEPDCYVKSTIVAAIAAIKRGGYKSCIPYLPQFYDTAPRKLKFIYNKQVNDDPRYRFDMIDTGTTFVTGKEFCYPTQNYLWRIKNAPRRGFFASKSGPIYHIGTDAAWLFEGLPVHSISDGVVRQISHNLSWGTFVVIETALDEKDTICTIYGHLDPYCDVKAGDVVKRGDKISQIGTSVTYDNGGYWAHLHLGIEKRSFNNAEIAGYDVDTLRYENPVTFIRQHRMVKSNSTAK